MKDLTRNQRQRKALAKIISLIRDWQCTSPDASYCPDEAWRVLASLNRRYQTLQDRHSSSLGNPVSPSR